MKKQEKSKSKEIDKATEVFRKGGIVIFPTDTVYGIGCKYDDPIALARVRRIKQSPQNFPILISNISQAHKLAKITPYALKIASHFWPGAVTIILWDKSGKEKIGLRIPDFDQLRSIIEKLGSPIVGTSANFHGQRAAKTFKELDKRLIEKADFIVKGRCKLGVESTVIDTTISPFKLIRQGAIKVR